MPAIITRDYDEAAYARLTAQHMHPVMARIYAARGISNDDELDTALASLLPAGTLKNCGQVRMAA